MTFSNNTQMKEGKKLGGVEKGGWIATMVEMRNVPLIFIPFAQFPRMKFDYILAARVTCQTLMTLSVYPANSVCPSEDQAKEIH